ncbi:hypothetical protein J8I87_03015 [Paraburkholderia sp. LEh10]|uniref:hypothetical protein n=1 Tax=Paraburkholderia sp. LEh10 TaxID=2821353 RepID=UPI001AE8C012|nr:hypothetical protein [Paraburkholderia sp. LEh10]MBP0588703.1 hypothetical protein [Paraburkholderia sp. LEh10]
MSEIAFVLPADDSGRKVSVKAFEAVMRLAVGGDRILRRVTTETYEEFVELLYEDLDQILGDLEDRKKYFAEASEDQISDAIISDLKRFGYSAHHDKDTNGHVDITVECRHKQGFSWLGEAKLDRGPKYCFGGLEQLTTRYSTARKNADRGGMLIYNRDYDNANNRMQQWADHLTNDHGIACDMNDAGRPGLAFSTAEAHKGTGLPYYIRHMFLHLHHDPQK